MRRVVRAVLCGLALQAAAVFSAEPAAAGDCKAQAIKVLKAASPNGYAVFQQVGDKAFFHAWLDCDDAQYGLPTAVHESLHHITGEADAYPLIGGGMLKRPPENRTLPAPSRIAHQFRPSVFVSTYLQPGNATAASDFRYLLDELNAYTHDLDTAIALADRRNPDVQLSHRDGLAALMSFVALYVEAAGQNTATWTALRDRPIRTAFVSLWDQAERTMLASCGIPEIGSEDRSFLGKLCGAGPQAALGRLLGRAPVCPRACLVVGPKTASRE
ncbi:hypothetical protein [Methylorubrum sp. SB2]|uniref:hypothetical protein n=1 Tax=Methylorubrum subtropicum TaxID=3138812 RepID=UPI00313E0FA0